MIEQAIGDRFRELTLKGVKDLLSEEEQMEWLTYYSLAVEQPDHLNQDACHVIGVQMWEWVDFCLNNIGNIARLRDRPIHTGFQNV